MELKAGQVAVITGGACGIGLGLAEQFARLGIHVVLADIDEADLANASKALADQPGEVLAVVTDVTKADQMASLADRTLEQFGRFDIICNNAGTVGKNMPLWEFESVEWEWIFAVDVWGVINGIAAFVPRLVEQGSGYVVNTSSMAGISTVALNGPYNAAKHAVVSISETLAADLAQLAPGVGVTVICPGPTRTRLMTDGPRSRPAHLRPTSDRGVAPQEVAIATLEAIERNQFMVAPHAGSRERVQRRMTTLLNDIAN
jgi:NAD(P)-dependent dehydrogenase (short-subunit alcohol dehydrogenase family)